MIMCAKFLQIRIQYLVMKEASTDSGTKYILDYILLSKYLYMQYTSSKHNA